MITNLFAIANVKQMRTYVDLEFYCFFFRKSWCVGVINSAIFEQFSQSVWVWQDFLVGFRKFGGGRSVEHPKPLPWVRHCVTETNGHSPLPGQHIPMSSIHLKCIEPRRWRDISL